MSYVANSVETKLHKTTVISKNYHIYIHKAALKNHALYYTNCKIIDEIILQNNENQLFGVEQPYYVFDPILK